MLQSLNGFSRLWSYAVVDTAIGKIMRDLDASVSVIVTSGDGMGPNYAGCHLIPEVLHKLGLYCAASARKGSSKCQ
jgi:hypothetical protein